MFEKDAVMRTGTRATATAILSNELVMIIVDARWLLLAILICVIADFRFGWGESSKRYKEAEKQGEKILMLQYRWRTSRALRRTVNKLIDYLIWVCVGMFVGMAIEPVGLSHIYGGVAATVVAVFCEAKSFFGHFFYLHGVEVRQKSIADFLKAFAVAFAKRKDEDVGEALEQGFNSINDKDNINSNEDKKQNS